MQVLVLTVCYFVGRTAAANQRMFNSHYLHEKQFLPKPRVAFTGVLCLKGKRTAMRANKKKSFRQNLKTIIIMSSSESASSHWMTKWSQYRILSTQISRNRRTSRSSSRLG